MADVTEKAAEKIIDTAANVAADVSHQAEGAEEAIRSLNAVKIQFGLLGLVIGGAIGAAAAYKFAYSKAETKYSKISDEEISEMRKMYRDKTIALEAEAAKRPLSEIIKERGYAQPDSEDTAPPMAIQPPDEVVTEEDIAEAEMNDIELPPKPRVRNVFQDVEPVTHVWDWHEERKKRDPEHPYVIHVDEKHDTPSYQVVTLTYYTKDDVLCNAEDEPMDREDRENAIGEGSLDRFGHGSEDASIVFVRNDQMELIFEIVKSPNAFIEEVHGIEHSDLYGGNLQRMRARERDEQEE